MTTEGAIQLALRLIAEGKPYTRTAVDDGDGESGPCAMKYRGFRLGQLFLECAPNGDTYLIAESKSRRHDDPYGYCPDFYKRLPSPYGQRKWNDNLGKPMQMRNGPSYTMVTDFRVRRISRALGRYSDTVRVTQSTRAQRKKNGRCLVPPRGYEPGYIEEFAG